MSIKATPNTVSGVCVSGTDFSVSNLPANTTAISYKRVIQSIVLYNRETTTINYRVLFGARTLFNFTLKNNESFVVENLKLVQDATDNTGTKITVECLTPSSTNGCNVVISYTDLQIPN